MGLIPEAGLNQRASFLVQEVRKFEQAKDALASGSGIYPLFESTIRAYNSEINAIAAERYHRGKEKIDRAWGKEFRKVYAEGLVEAYTSSDGIHRELDAAGLIPVAGIVFDVGNGVFYLYEGDKLNAGVSALAAVPVVGTLGPIARVAAKNADELVDAGRAAANLGDAASAASSAAKLGDGTKAGTQAAKHTILNIPDWVELAGTAKKELTNLLKRNHHFKQKWPEIQQALQGGGTHGLGEHTLHGPLKGFRAIRVPNGQNGAGALRIIFQRKNGKVLIRAITDYH